MNDRAAKARRVGSKICNLRRQCFAMVTKRREVRARASVCETGLSALGSLFLQYVEFAEIRVPLKSDFALGTEAVTEEERVCK